MSTLFRLVRSQGTRNGLTFLASKNIRVHNALCRSVSSTPKKDDTATTEPYTVKPVTTYGFYNDNPRLDKHFMHLTFFVTISICLVGGAFIMAYMPDPSLRDWAQREAYLQIRYKEEHGLPYIDPNVVDPSKFTLPTEEELLDTEIII